MQTIYEMLPDKYLKLSFIGMESMMNISDLKVHDFTTHRSDIKEFIQKIQIDKNVQ